MMTPNWMGKFCCQVCGLPQPVPIKTMFGCICPACLKKLQEAWENAKTDAENKAKAGCK